MKRSRNKPPGYLLRSDYIYVDIEREEESATTDSFGEPVMTWIAQKQNVKCHFESTRYIGAGGLPMTGAGQAAISEFLAIFALDTGIRARDRIKDIDANYYRVTDVRSFETHTEVYCDIMELD